MDIARTSMIHARAPHFLWPYAVHYAAHQLNLQPRVSRPEASPTSLWTGSPGVGSAFRVWGCLALVRDTFADIGDSSRHPLCLLWFPGLPVPLPPLFLAPSPPPAPAAPVPPPPPGPAPSGVSHATPLPSVARQVLVDSGGVGAGGADTGGARSGVARSQGARAGGASSGGAGTGGASSGGVGAGGAGAGGASSGGAGAGGVGTGGASSGGAGAGGTDTGGATSGDTGTGGASSEETGVGDTTSAVPAQPPHRHDWLGPAGAAGAGAAATAGEAAAAAAVAAAAAPSGAAVVPARELPPGPWSSLLFSCPLSVSPGLWPYFSSS
ncbi:unnamed protein product [Closterium sp. NIES-53]